jgi:ABC-2 type transport system ATP-binding protein
MTPAIEVAGLTKEYRRRGGRRHQAVDGLDLTVPEGTVYGFLGPNGSGKTTTIRCLLGLVRPGRGDVRVLGAPIPDRLPTVIGRVGAIVETPALFPTMTGRANLRLLGGLEGIGAGTVDRVLERVGLLERADDRVRTYSLGMRQRLGLGAALLKDPALLVLDEPANGLDPAGIREVRFLLRELAAEGRTVFVSSHQLDEVVRTCDQVAILRRGRCVAAGPVGDVLRSGRRSTMVVRVDDLDAGSAVLRSAGYELEVGDGYLEVTAPPEEGARITEALAGRDLWVSELRPAEDSLEAMFLDLTSDDDGDREVAA